MVAPCLIQDFSDDLLNQNTNPAFWPGFMY